jgi:hypothetical protein
MGVLASSILAVSCAGLSYGYSGFYDVPFGREKFAGNLIRNIGMAHY